MFTATKDLILPTTTCGSWPKPQWYNEQLRGRALSSAMKEVAFREQYTDALASLMDEQRRAGLDVFVHGDYHHDTTVGGQHWIAYPLERMEGMEGDYTFVADEIPPERPGSILNEVYSAWKWPKVISKVQRSEATPLEYAKIWRLAQARATKPVMFGGISAQVAAFGGHYIAEDSGYDRDAYKQLTWDLVEAFNQEYRELAAAGCKVIQIEEPFAHEHAFLHPDDTDMIDFYVDAWNKEVEGLDGVEIWAHTCWGSASMQRGPGDVTYDHQKGLEALLERMKYDVLTVEARTDDGKVFEALKPWRQTIIDNKKKIAVGAVSHRDLQVETPEQVADFMRRAMEVVPIENLALTSDCGFGRGGAGRMIAMYKASSLAQGANIIRREQGLPETYVPAADPSLQVDSFDRGNVGAGSANEIWGSGSKS